MISAVCEKGGKCIIMSVTTYVLLNSNAHFVNVDSYMSKGELTPPIHWDRVMSHAHLQNEHRY